MNRHKLAWFRALALALVAVLTVGLVATAEAPSFKKRIENEKRFAAEVGDAIVHAAHKTAKKISMEEFKYVNPKPNRTELKLKMGYVGALTGAVSAKKYLANITVKIDSADKNAWEVLSIDYSDNNTLGHSRKKLEELIKEMNR